MLRNRIVSFWLLLMLFFSLFYMIIPQTVKADAPVAGSITFHWIEYESDNTSGDWSNQDFAVDNDHETYSDCTQAWRGYTFSNTNYTAQTNKIIKYVYIVVKYSSGAGNLFNCTPIFKNVTGTVYQNSGTYPATYVTIDITNSTNGPGLGNWQWTDIQKLDLRISKSASDTARIYNANLTIEYSTFDNYFNTLTDSAVSVNSSYATLKGNVVINSTMNITCFFQYGTTITYSTNTTNQTFNSSNAVSQIISGLASSTLYHYRSVAVNASNFTFGVDKTFLTKPDGPTSPDVTLINATTVNLTWVKAGNTNNTINKTVIVYRTDTPPSNVDDGTIAYNDTGNYSLQTIVIGTTYYYRAWSYSINDTLYQFSENYSDFSSVGGGLYINCFSETTLANLTFNVSISNVSGSQVYNAYGCTNTKTINASQCPQGLVSILVSAENYYNRTYYLTILPNLFYLLNAYLAPSTQLYLLTITNELGQTLSNVETTIKKYINTTGIYQIISTTYTDGAGQTSLYLVPGTQYKVFLTKTGYTQSGSNDWIPDELIYTKTFKMASNPSVPQEPIDPNDIIFTGTLTDSTTALITYNDTTLGTKYAILEVTTYNYNTSTWAVVGTYNYTAESWNSIFSSLDRTKIYYFNLTFNHKDIGLNHRQYIVDRILTPPVNESEINDRFDWIGVIPIGASNFFMWLFLIATMFYADERDIGKITIILGVFFIFINVFIGWHTALVGAFAGGLPFLFICIGVLIEWGNARRRGD